MGHPVSVRLERDIQTTLEEAARERGIGLSTYLRELAAQEARRLRRERIRAQSRAVAQYVAATPEAQAFFDDWGFDDWGTPAADPARR
jgi:predicted DNA-binding ribbon-helix-helix protein